MFLSRISLDIRHPGVRQALRDCDDMHKTVMSAFGQSDGSGFARKDMSMLYRLDCRDNEMYLLLESAQPPDAAALRKNGFMLAEPSKDISALEGVFQNGMELRFELLTAPCKKIKGDGKNSKRVFLKTSEERLAWLNRQGEKYGFEPISVQESAKHTHISGDKNGMRIYYEAVLFWGALRIKDAGLFWDCYKKGIGPGKSYGLGMITVAKG